MPSQNGCRASDNGFLAMSLESYLKLLDWTGRQLRSDGKRGRISPEVAPILERLGITSGVWCDAPVKSPDCRVTLTNASFAHVFDLCCLRQLVRQLVPKLQLGNATP